MTNGVADLATNVRKLGLFEGVDEYGRVTADARHGRSREIITDTRCRRR